MPTITVVAPRSLAISAMLLNVREPKESSTSRAATSMITPLERCSPIWWMRSFWNRTIWESSSAVWMDAMR